MDDNEFDKAMVSAGFAQAALFGWRGLSMVDAARAAGLPLDRARARFPGPAALLMRFGLLADQAALHEPVTEGTERERLFDLLMRRFDSLQEHRAGILAVLRAAPLDPGMSLGLGFATLRSMAWMMEAAGISAAGLRGVLRAQGVTAIWLYTLKAWMDDDSADLMGTMAALDKALDQAARFAPALGGGAAASSPVDPADDPLEGVVDLGDDPGPPAPFTSQPVPELPPT